MEHTILLENIYKNFDKVFINCTETQFYKEPLFSTSSDIESMIVINNIITLISLCKIKNDPLYNLTLEMLKCMITIKCKEFVNKKNIYSYSNNTTLNSDNFTKTFFDYLNKLI
jgi:hypothetical protein